MVTAACWPGCEPRNRREQLRTDVEYLHQVLVIMKKVQVEFYLTMRSVACVAERAMLCVERSQGQLT